MPPFTSETARRARQRKAGLAAARYWRGQDFANLKLARQQRSQIALSRRLAKMIRELAEYNLTVFHRPTGRQVTPEMLTRRRHT
jgi:hypothetical protein